ELVSGSSRVPQLRFPPTAAGTLSGAAGYYDLLPFAGLVGSGGAVGLLSIGGKYRMLSESDGAPVGLAVHAHFGIPIHKSIDFLLTHPVGTADLQFGFDGIVSKRLGGIAELYWNVGYRHINQPAHVSVFRLGEELPLGFGFTRSEEHTSELQSRVDLVCRLLLEKKNIVRYAPYALRRGEWATEGEKIAERVTAIVEGHLPGEDRLNVDTRVITHHHRAEWIGLTQ